MKYKRDGLTNYRKSSKTIKESHRIKDDMDIYLIYKWGKFSPHKPILIVRLDWTQLRFLRLYQSIR